MQIRRRIGYLAAVLLGACSEHHPLTQIVVVTDTDLAVPAAIDQVRFVVVGPDGVESHASRTVAGLEDFPLSLGLLHESGGPLGPIHVTVTGMRGGSDVVRNEAITSFVHGEIRLLTLPLLASCVGVSCGDGMACAETGCRAIEIPGSDLPPFDGTLPRLDTSDGGMVDAGPPDTMDGGRDAGMTRDGGIDGDAGADAGVDPDADAGPDAGFDAGPPCIAETCNMSDDDCDGMIDEGAVCPCEDGMIHVGDECVRCDCTNAADRCIEGPACVRDGFTCSPIAPCPTGYSCSDTTCVCADRNTCGVECNDDDTCPSPLACDTVTRVCREQLIECVTELGCSASELCSVDAFDQRNCVAAPVPGTRANGALCTSDSECASLRCSTVCLAPCDSSADCTSGLVCDHLGDNYSRPGPSCIASGVSPCGGGCGLSQYCGNVNSRDRGCVGAACSVTADCASGLSCWRQVLDLRRPARIGQCTSFPSRCANDEYLLWQGSMFFDAYCARDELCWLDGTPPACRSGYACESLRNDLGVFVPSSNTGMCARSFPLSGT